MSDAIFSPSWYRVEGLRPRLRPHGEIHRHVYRGETWYVLEDHASGRYHRFTPEVNEIIGALDGRRTVGEIWERANATLGDDAPTQHEIIRLLGQLHAADLIQADVSPDTEELFERYRETRRKQWLQKLSHPLAIKIPLLDPERFLVRALPFVRPLFSWFGFAF